jgi:DNA-binding NarL/FixJ family response regulator
MTKVLIVDDLNSIREFLKINLSSETDIEVVGFADNGQRAIAQAEKHQPDIILMDINMPGEIDGIQATETISRRVPQSKILLLTSQDEQQQLERALKAGSRGYILKNTSIKDLANIIRLAEKGFFQIGPILGDWDGTLHSLARVSTGQSETTTEVGKTKIIPHNFNYRPETEQTSQMNHTLSNFSSELLQLQETIKSQESTIVNLTHKYSQVQHEIKNKFGKERSSSKNLGFAAYGSEFIKGKMQKQRHILFITSFFLGALTVLFFVLIVMLLGSM